VDNRVRLLSLELLETLFEQQDEGMPLGDCVQAVVYLLAYLTETQTKPEPTAQATVEAYEYAREQIRAAMAPGDRGGLPN
jgi:hypothetical protein